MPRYLFLLRHAKPESFETAKTDHKRTLAAAGKEYCQLLANQMQAQQYIPDHIIASDSKRTIETAEIITNIITPTLTIQKDKALYQATAGDMLKTINQFDESKNAILMVGHNPTTQQTATLLTENTDHEGWQTLRVKYSAGSLAIFEINSSWQEVRPASATLIDYIDAKALSAK